MALCYMSYPDGSEAIYLDEDPTEYDDSPPERRMSSTPTAGDRVWQDFGAPEVDRQIKLKTYWMTATTLALFRGRFAVVGQVWKWVDHEAAEYRVVCRDLKAEHIRGYDAYEVAMTLDVVETRGAESGADSGVAAEAAALEVL